MLNFGRLKDWGLRIKGPEIRESGCMYIKKRVNYINGHYGLSVFAHLVTELFFHQV